jgi:membrane-associated phospholipid phosphatase
MNIWILTILEQLKTWDQWLFMKLNSQWTNSFFDNILPFTRESALWAPLYLFLLLFITINFKGKGWWWALLFICTVSLTDIISSRVFKNGFQRLRPCSDPQFMMHVRLLVNYCSGGYGFTSSHAANHFGIATFFYFTLRHVIGRWALIGFFWAAIICYAQVYVGVHYPLDIVGGAILGICFGLFTGMIFNKRFGFVNFGRQNNPAA